MLFPRLIWRGGMSRWSEVGGIKLDGRNQMIRNCLRQRQHIAVTTFLLLTASIWVARVICSMCLSVPASTFQFLFLVISWFLTSIRPSPASSLYSCNRNVLSSHCWRLDNCSPKWELHIREAIHAALSEASTLSLVSYSNCPFGLFHRCWLRRSLLFVQHSWITSTVHHNCRLSTSFEFLGYLCRMFTFHWRHHRNDRPFPSRDRSRIDARMATQQWWIDGALFSFGLSGSSLAFRILWTACR